jgi:hypothetical protein
MRAGRKTVVARARARSPSSRVRTVTHEFEFDAEPGTVLCRATLDRGQPVSVTEAVRVQYDRPIEAECFDLAAPGATLPSMPVAGR